jgi:hypothetical protein
MTRNHSEIPWPDPNFEENNRQFPLDELAKYAGQHIAWSWDGKQIPASAADRDELERKLVEAGIDPSRVAWDYVMPPDVSLLPSLLDASAIPVVDDLSCPEEPIMNNSKGAVGPPAEFFENQKTIKPEDLVPYAGKHIAWSWDGAHIVASGATVEEVEQQLKASGIDPCKVGWDYVPPLDVSLLL